MGAVDLEAFLARLKALGPGAMPKAGPEMRSFVNKIKDCLQRLEQEEVARGAAHAYNASVAAEMAHLSLTSFAELRCWIGAAASWPVLRRGMRLDDASAPPRRSGRSVVRTTGPSPQRLVEALWAISGVPRPSREVVNDVVPLASALAPHLGYKMSPLLLYRSVFGVARMVRVADKGCEDFRKRAASAVVAALSGQDKHQLAPAQLVRLCWAFARLGEREEAVFAALENRLSKVIVELSDKELEAVKGIVTQLDLAEQWKLVKQVEHELLSRRHEKEGETKDRKNPFRKKWKKVSVLDPVVPKKKVRKKQKVIVKITKRERKPSVQT
eukprot:TRINITY_DN59273_c0_g1_i4.p1 TRINITY_DN59273_c0_g1~~TRINITY_DN59273_c0_g1_i4.p1  ORF type:complete len:327 (+),score=84.66 TRINITY_DN59273_c0_g1_i4:2-982(+)